MRNIVIVAHKDLTHPDDELVKYLNLREYDNVFHINHSFFYAKDRKSWYVWYKKGKIYKEHYSLDYKFLPEPFIYLKEMIFTITWILSTRLSLKSYIGMDGLCVLWGNLLRGIGIVKKTHYWAIDFVPNDRFDSSILNKIYHWINIHGYKNSDEMWDLSPRMVEAREKYLEITKGSYKKHMVVPYGVWTNNLRRYPYSKCEKNTLVYMGHLSKKQGVQIVIKAIPDIVKVNPKFRLKIIGSGAYGETLRDLAKRLKVDKYCNFLGKIDDYSVLEDEVARSCVAIAPYLKKYDTWTYYADPGKVKTYIGNGVPLVLTDIPWNSTEIQQNRCGVIADQNHIDISNKVLYLMESRINSEYRKNAAKYAQKFDYEHIFSKLFN